MDFLQVSEIELFVDRAHFELSAAQKREGALFFGCGHGIVVVSEIPQQRSPYGRLTGSKSGLGRWR